MSEPPANIDPPAGFGFGPILEFERSMLPRDVHDVGSMLSYDERLLLHWAARTAAPGAIIDLGSFLGGSTLALARGAEQRGATIDAFDLFICRGEIENTWAPEGSRLALGDSTRSLFERNVAAVADRVVVHEGDICDQDWHQPVSVLFIDITKSWETADHVWRTFLPHVQPGGVVVQQDLVHWGHPWCAVIMEALAEHFEFLGWVWFSSAVYRCRQAPTKVPVPMLDRFTCEEMLALIERAAERIGEPASHSIRLSGAVVLASFGRFDDARGRVDAIRAENSRLPYIEEGFARLDWWIDETARAATA